MGDKSTAGGVVTVGIATTSVMGQQLTHIGASVMCPACSSVGHIVPTGPRFPDGWMGQKVALEGDKVSCGCYPMPTMLPSQSVMFEQYDGEGLSSMGFAATDVAALTKAAVSRIKCNVSLIQRQPIQWPSPLLAFSSRGFDEGGH
ncbi:PAAR domain-containing protein [Burkholderia ubonensis]|uniref:PAAR domain-containing protein n=1 Tax=Burkholderia ubonensis TaxID=101571 RepID=UPI0039F477C7